MHDTRRRILCHPLAAPILVALFALDLRLQVPPPGHSGGSSMRALLWGAGECGTLPSVLARRAVPDDGLWNFVDMSRDPRWTSRGDPDPRRSNLYFQADHSANITFRPTKLATGFWAITRVRHGGKIDVNQALPQDQLTSMRREFVRTIVSSVCPMPTQESAQLQIQDISKDRVMWMGYAHNAAALLMAAWLPFACVGFWRTLRALGPNRRRKMGLCVGCGYDLSGVKGKCPECGRGAVA